MSLRNAGILCLVLMLATMAARARPALPFTYQGRLLTGGLPLTGTMDFQCALYDSSTGGAQIGATLACEDIAVANGLFVLTLDFDAAFNLDERWLALGVRPGASTGSFTPLDPRQRVSFAPRALYALQADGVPWSGISGVPAGFADGVDNDTTYTAGTGLALTGATFAIADDALLWRVGGNSGLSLTDFLGTTDVRPLRFKVNNYHALRLEPPAAAYATYPPNIIGGYLGNDVGVDAYGSVVCGGGASGEPNLINGACSTIGGGTANTVDGNYAGIIAGYRNAVSGDYGIAGGYQNTVSDSYSIALGYVNSATGTFSTALGCSNTASGYDSLALGYFNSASGTCAVALGRESIASGSHSFALGNKADTNAKNGAFVWGDLSTSNAVTASAANQFTARAAGGVRLYTNATLTSGVTLAAGGSAWNVVSDRHAKECFAAVDTSAILRKVAALPLTTWSYKAQAPAYRHLGPMAQDFQAAFGLGEGDDRVINTLDLDGVTLAAVQGLCRELEGRDAKIARLEGENADLRALLADLAKRVQALEQQ